MENIKDLEGHNVQMQKALDDKLYFLDYLKEIDTFEDFGCADGTILKAVSEHYPTIKLEGVDANGQMTDKCHKNIPSAYIKQDICPIGTADGYRKRVLNLSSVLHKVYSYGTPESISHFWNTIMTSDYEYIFIRDMIFHNEDYSPIDHKTEINFWENVDPTQLHDFEDVWGPIVTKKDLNHFLLKYRYTANWQREVKEQYLCFTPDQLLSMFSGKYECVFIKTYTLPFHKYVVKKDFDIDVKEDTHIQVVLKRIR